MVDDVVFFEDFDSPFRPDMPLVERNVVHVILRNPATKEVLCLDWKKHGWHVFVVGGIEGNEDLIETAMREVKEETGYTNIRFVTELGKTRTRFFAAHKNENRIANATGLLFELIDSKQEEVSEEESGQFSPAWIPESEVASFINVDNQRHIWNKALEYLGV